MPYSKDPSRYPREFMVAFKRALDKDVQLSLASEGLAISLHHKLNAFRVACEHAKVEGSASMRDITISRSGTKLILSNTANALSNVFEDLGPTDDELEEYLAQAEKANDRETRVRSDIQQAVDGEQGTPEESGEEGEKSLESISEFYSTLSEVKEPHS